MAVGRPGFGATNGAPELNIGTPNTARAVANAARYTCKVMGGADAARKVEQASAQQNLVTQDDLGVDPGQVVWNGRLWVSGHAVLHAIRSELNAFQHGSLRDVNGRLGEPSLAYIRPTQLVDSFGNVMSDRARLEEWTIGEMHRATLLGANTLTAELRIVFKLLG